MPKYDDVRKRMDEMPAAVRWLTTHRSAWVVGDHANFQQPNPDADWEVCLPNHTQEDVDLLLENGGAASEILQLPTHMTLHIGNNIDVHLCDIGLLLSRPLVRYAWHPYSARVWRADPLDYTEGGEK